MVRDETINRLRRLKPRFAEMGIKRMAVFGSVARDEDTIASDLDILVDLEKNLSFSAYFSIKKELEEYMGSKIDLVTFDSIRAPHYRHILTEAMDV